MKIDAIARLFSSNSQSAQATAKQTATTKETSENENSEAVKVNTAFGKADELSKTERQERIASLKKQVADGTYSPNSRAVAESLARELFA